MRKVAISLLVIFSISLFAQKSIHHDLRQTEIQDIHDFDPFRHHCSKFEIKRSLHFRTSADASPPKNPIEDSSSISFQAYNSSWQAIGPEGGNVRDMFINQDNNNEMFSVTYGYPSFVFKTTNAGQTWSKIATINTYVYLAACDPTEPNTIYLSTGQGIYKSEDGGVSWVYTPFCSYFYCTSIGDIVISPFNSSILYIGAYYREAAGSGGMAILKSIDGGDNWTGIKLSPEVQYGDTFSVAIDPTDPDIHYAGGYYYDGDNLHSKVYKTTDGGGSWIDITGSINGYPYAIAIDATNPSRVYVGTSWGIFRSTDGGQTWQRNSGYAYAYSLAIDPLDSDIIYAGYNNSCYKSVNGGVNWSRYSIGLHGRCYRILAYSDSPTRVFYGSNAGIYKSEDSGISWEASHSGIKANQIPSLAVSPSSPNIIYAEATANGMFKSHDFGINWERLPYFYRCDSITKIVVNSDDANNLFILAGG